MASAEELLNGVSAPDFDGTVYCYISNRLRTVVVPSMVSILGVANDKGFKCVYFRMERWYCGSDLSEFDLRIVYKNANGQEGASPAWDVTTSGDGEYITFYWKVDSLTTKCAGSVQFIVCARKMDSEDVILQEFNTTIATATVLDGLSVVDDAGSPITAEQLALLSSAEVLSYIEAGETDICSVDFDTRAIWLGISAPILGVENDKDVHIIPFRVPRYYEGVDLSTFDICVNYENAAGAKYVGVTKVLSTSEDYILFAWLVDYAATEKAGTVRFALQLRSLDSYGNTLYELNTISASAVVLAGLENADGEGAAARASAILGVAVLGEMVLGNGSKLSAPVIELVKNVAIQLDSPEIYLSYIAKPTLSAPYIQLYEEV